MTLQRLNIDAGRQSTVFVKVVTRSVKFDLEVGYTKSGVQYTYDSVVFNM